MKRLMRLMAATLLVVMCMSMFATVAVAASKVVAMGDCNIRSGAGTYYASKGVLHKGEKLTYKDSRKRDDRGVYWLRVEYKGKKAWVSTVYAKIGGSSSDDRVVEATGSVNVRKSPNNTAKKLGSVSKGKKLPYRGKMSVDSNGHAWFAVYYKGDPAWVSALYTYLK